MSPKIDPDNVRIFSGRSNPSLAAGIANYLGVPLSETAAQHFANDCLGVQLSDSVRGRIVYIVQSLTSPVQENLMELLMMLDIARNAAAKEVHAIIPYYAYARSDKKDAPRISITARLVADLLKTAGATHVMTMQLHTPQVHGFFSLPTDPLTARGLFVSHLRQYEFDPETAVVVAPDAGIAKSAARLARLLGLAIAVGSKQRFSDTNVKISKTIKKQVKGYDCAIIYDDEISTGSSVVELSRILLKSGVSRICVVCTHGLFSGQAIERLNSIPQIEAVITTDTVPPPSKEALPTLRVLSVAETFGEAIRKNYHHESIGSLFTFWEDDDDSE
ncbi:MAG TPA: ribose-phosphate pyrophosphokinase [Caldilineae bacterium]|nr:ribose-phosphate pyrophosphokinase [Caldilineae bacterium]